MAIRVRPGERVYQPGAVIIAEGAEAASLFIVTRGRVAVTKQDHRQGRVLLDELGPGSVLGEMALVDAQVRSASVEAVELTTCIEIPGELVERQVRRAGPLVATLLQVMALRLRHAGAALATLRREGCPMPDDEDDDPETARHLVRSLAALEEEVRRPRPQAALGR